MICLAVALMAGAEAFTGSFGSRRPVATTTMSATATKTFPNLPATVKPGVVTGAALKDLLQYAKDNEFAIPGVNIVGKLRSKICHLTPRRALLATTNRHTHAHDRTRTRTSTHRTHLSSRTRHRSAAHHCTFRHGLNNTRA